MARSDNPYQHGSQCGTGLPLNDTTETSTSFEVCTRNEGSDENLCQKFTYNVVEPDANPWKGKMDVFNHGGEKILKLTKKIFI